MSISYIQKLIWNIILVLWLALFHVCIVESILLGHNIEPNY